MTTEKFANQTFDAVSYYGVTGFSTGGDADACSAFTPSSDDDQKIRSMLFTPSLPYLLEVVALKKAKGLWKGTGHGFDRRKILTVASSATA
jgi:hypothetical protein